MKNRITYYEMVDKAHDMARAQKKFDFQGAMGIWHAIVGVSMTSKDKLMTFESCLDKFAEALSTGVLSF